MVIIKHISTINISFSDDHKIQYHIKIVLCLLYCINLADNNPIRQIIIIIITFPFNYMSNKMMPYHNYHKLCGGMTTFITLMA